MSQGTVQQSGGVTSFNIGTLAAGQTVTASISAAALEAGVRDKLRFRYGEHTGFEPKQ